MPVPFGSVVLPQPDFSRTSSSTPRMRAASKPGGAPAGPASCATGVFAEKVEAELQRILAGRGRELVDERLRREGDAVAARRAQRARSARRAASPTRRARSSG